MGNKQVILPFIVGLLIVLTSCNKVLPQGPNEEDVLAAPLEGLTPSQMATHVAGDQDFAHIFTEDQGLGPIFVSFSCESCHVGDGKGHPLTKLIRFGKMGVSSFDPMLSEGGPQLQHRSISNYSPEAIPSSATGVAGFIAPPVTGLGFIEAVHDSTIISWDDSLDLDGDGISGRVHWVSPPEFFTPKAHHIGSAINGVEHFIGRYGKKATSIDLTMQTAGAYRNDMGITSDFIEEDLINVQVGDLTGDNVADPEISSATVKNVVFYLRTLKAPPRRNESDQGTVQGKQIFDNIGCGKCHRESMTTGSSDVSTLSNVIFHPYTDLLLHDMGNDLNDNYTEGRAEKPEWRTAPLWGLGLSKDAQGGNYHLMHDGRATSIEGAIGFHGGEGATSRTAYSGLTAEEKKQLIQFLESL